MTENLKQCLMETLKKEQRLKKDIKRLNQLFNIMERNIVKWRSHLKRDHYSQSWNTISQFTLLMKRLGMKLSIVHPNRINFLKNKKNIFLVLNKRLQSYQDDFNRLKNELIHQRSPPPQ